MKYIIIIIILFITFLNLNNCQTTGNSTTSGTPTPTIYTSGTPTPSTTGGTPTPTIYTSGTPTPSTTGSANSTSGNPTQSPSTSGGGTTGTGEPKNPNNCPIQDKTLTTTGPRQQTITILDCLVNYGTKCTPIVNKQVMQAGDTIITEDNGNGFTYVGNNKVCYSVYSRESGCMGQSGTSTCENYCFESSPGKAQYDIQYTKDLGYYCDTLWTRYYAIIINDNDGGDGSDPSSSFKLLPTLLSSTIILIFGFLLI